MTEPPGRRVPLPRALTDTRIVAILRRLPASHALDRIALLAECGIGAIEVTIDSPGALDVITRARAAHPGIAIGAGTVRTSDDLSRAAVAGASFALSPHCDPGLIAAAAGLGLAYLPGAATPTEAVTAWAHGASAVKLFPAEPSGPALLAAIRQPLPDIPFVPTGGVTPDNAAAYFAAGAAAVSVGGALTALAPAEMAAAARRLRGHAEQAPPWT
jgi:2-dehydro-3-deoxyphosphogluconate aldolase/(4S)-4-hydroxy-2-oxoglutarate aldolase